ncbi:unnamed protein product, partial [marine sediment metagenome]
SLLASNCSSLSWALVVKKDGTEIYSASGTIPSDEWDHYVSYILSEGDYTATFSVGGTVQRIEDFSVWGHEASMDVSPGYSGEDTKFTLNATNCSGKDAHFQILKSVEDYYELVYELTIPIYEDPWSHIITYTLQKGDYGADFLTDGVSEQWVEFSIVERGVPAPPVEEEEKEEAKPKPKKEKPKNTAMVSTRNFKNRFFITPPF